jgi:hypothetical protein
VYQFVLTKHADLLADVLERFKGVFLFDAESRLNEICDKGGVRRATGNAHPRRQFRDAESAQPILAIDLSCRSSGQRPGEAAEGLGDGAGLAPLGVERSEVAESVGNVGAHREAVEPDGNDTSAKRCGPLEVDCAGDELGQVVS